MRPAPDRPAGERLNGDRAGIIPYVLALALALAVLLLDLVTPLGFVPWLLNLLIFLLLFNYLDRPLLIFICSIASTFIIIGLLLSPAGLHTGLFMSKTITEKNMGRLIARNTAEGAEFRIEV